MIPSLKPVAWALLAVTLLLLLWAGYHGYAS